MPRWVGLASAVAGLALMLSASAVAAGSATILVSVSVTGGAGNGVSRVDALTNDGRFVLFDSRASNLVVGDTNHRQDVFVRDVQSGDTFRVSVGPQGRQATGDCYGSAISPDGRFVVFESAASNLTRHADSNAALDVFVRDRQTGETSRVSVPDGGGEFKLESGSGVISADGRYVSFAHLVDSVNSRWHTYVRDRLLHTTHIVGGRHGENSEPAAISSDGRYLAWYRVDGVGQVLNFFLRDRTASHNIYVPTPTFPVSNVVMSPDARYLTFGALDVNGSVDDTYQWHRGDSAATTVSTDPVYFSDPVGMSNDGRFVAVTSDNPNLVAGDTNSSSDVYRIDAVGPTTIRTSLTAEAAELPSGGSGTPSLDVFGPGIQGNLMSEDGIFVAFDTNSPAVANDTNTHADVYLRGPL